MAEVYPSFEKLSLDHLERKQSIDVYFSVIHHDPLQIANIMKEKAKAMIKPIKGKQILEKIFRDPSVSSFSFSSQHNST